MDALSEHTIAFSGLKDGTHAFHFDLGSAFFAVAADEDMEGGCMAVDVELEKSPTMLVANIRTKGILELHCDHCNEPMELPLEGSQRQVFHLNGRQRFEEEEDDVVGLDPTDHEVNLTHYIYECIRLALPLRRAHAAGQCDPEVDRALGRINGVQEAGPDPRWKALDQLKRSNS